MTASAWAEKEKCVPKLLGAFIVRVAANVWLWAKCAQTLAMWQPLFFLCQPMGLLLSLLVFLKYKSVAAHGAFGFNMPSCFLWT